MTKVWAHFMDGPAAGVRLTLGRGPILLRVVKNAAGEWDALDQPTDEPKPDETIYAYAMDGEPGYAMVDGRDKQGKRFGYRAEIVRYIILPVQPPAESLTNTGWQVWCEANRDRQIEAYKARCARGRS